MRVHMRTDSVQQIALQIGKDLTFRQIINNLGGNTLILKGVPIAYLHKFV